MNVRERIERLSHWLDDQLRLRHATMGCLFMAAMALPFMLAATVMLVWALLDAEAGRFYDPGWLPPVAALGGLSVGICVVVLAWGLPRRHSAQLRPLLAPVMVTWLLFTATVFSLLYGHKDTPTALAILAALVLVRLWFPLRLVLPGLLLGAVLVIAAELAQARGTLRYAPLLAAPVVDGQPLAWWWALWLRVIFDLALLIFAGPLFFVFGHMERRHRELEELTRMDALTGLLNRGSFVHVLESEFGKQLRSRRPACVMMCDVDHFKRVNDTWGHAAGDAVLARLGQILGEAVRTPLDVPARFGGEEFVVLLPETGLAAALRVAERIRARLAAEDFESEGQPFRVTLSIGVAEADDGDGELALQVADANLYQAKRSGRDRVVGSRLEPAPADIPSE